MDIDLKHKITIKDILEVTKGELLSEGTDINTECKKFNTNTNYVDNEDLYIGLIGEKTNGGLYFEQALEKGAIGAIIQDIEITEKQLEKYNNRFIIKVEDSLKALQEIAKLKREKYKDVTIVAITGSVGKTSTKDIIANVLSQKYKTLKTEGNFNNHIGLPSTILRLNDEEVAVVEMGMNHFGEINVLTNIAKPNLCVITNIGTSHIGNLGSRENILKAKLEILEGNEEKELVINNDNDILHEYCVNQKDEKIVKGVHIYTYGINEKSQVYATEIKKQEENSKFICHTENSEFEVIVPVAGEHFIYNALCAVTVGKKLGLTDEQIKKGIETFELTKKRMDIDTLSNGIKIINDAYNASYESMKGAIENLSNYKNRKIAVLGDMFELGEYSEELHRKVGNEIAKNNIDILLCTGENSKYIVEEAKKQGTRETYYFNNKEELLYKLKEIIKNDDVILFKASNGMKFFDLAEQLKKEYN